MFKPMLLRICVNVLKHKISPIFSLKPGASVSHRVVYHFCQKNSSQGKEGDSENDSPYADQGTEYTMWILARSAKHNHDVSFLKRKYGRDRYNIHKLTNMHFMCSLVNRQDKYALNLNEHIVLLAQMNHVCNVLNKDKGMYSQFHQLIRRITKGIRDPDDYICMGTFMNVLVDLGHFSHELWVLIMDALFVKKYDQEYDQLFGLYAGLYKYRLNIQEFSDYFALQKNKVIYNIPIIYRNSLEIIRQYVKYNIYNLKECRILFRALHRHKINEQYFWKSVHNWFNIYIKEQLATKQFSEFFIVSESAVDKVLFDDGIIRPRSVLEELAQIAFILTEHGFLSHRFVTFIENLILYSIDMGSQLFIKYLEIQKQEKNQKTKPEQPLNKHMRTTRESQEDSMKKMQKKYKTIFVNPTDINSQSIIYVLMVLKRSFQGQKTRSNQKEYQTNNREEGRTGAVDLRVLNWLLVRLCQPKMKYTVNELLKIIECQDFLQTMKLNLKSLIHQKIRDVRSKVCSLADLETMLFLLPLEQFEEISYILEDFLFRAHPKDILTLTQTIERESMTEEDYEALGEEATAAHLKKTNQEDESAEYKPKWAVPKEKKKRWMPYMTNYFLKLAGAVNYHSRYYSFEENCYFLYILLKNQEYWESRIDYEYMGQMEKLKHSIKIASYSRGFKLQMGTYFYKLMNYIDLVAFFDGG